MQMLTTMTIKQGMSHMTDVDNSINIVVTWGQVHLRSQS